VPAAPRRQAAARDGALTTENLMALSIIGAGNVGQALAQAFTTRGESVFLGVPDPWKYARVALARGARAVTAFNTTGAENVADSRYPGGAAFMPVCGDDADARTRVVALATLIGFDAADCGDLRAARCLEPFATTWIHLALRLGHGRRFAFARLHR
jgi:predicted dinucleotide-binding enzyme